VPRIPGDPGPLRWLRYAAGLRLPPENRDWVRHDLTDAGWRVRAAVRALVRLLPLVAICAVLPGAWAIRALLIALVVIGGVAVGLLYADTIRAGRLRQHGLAVPDDHDLGRPTDEP
jgi:hypothetical protein